MQLASQLLERRVVAGELDGHGQRGQILEHAVVQRALDPPTAVE
jgi:hypothetical protein